CLGRHRVSDTTRRGTMATEHRRAILRRLHVADRSPLVKDVLDAWAFMGFGVVAVLLWRGPLWPLTPLAWLLGGFIGHAKPLSLHDAAHGILHPNPRLNEVMAVGLGTLVLVPVTVYRHAHARHHACLASERDPELRPLAAKRAADPPR
ncbi:MAG: fatty acid desaturase, partial [Planctomycetaceae bacterium]